MSSPPPTDSPDQQLRDLAGRVEEKQTQQLTALTQALERMVVIEKQVEEFREEVGTWPRNLPMRLKRVEEALERIEGNLNGAVSPKQFRVMTGVAIFAILVAVGHLIWALAT
ncbi:hypothetical protein CMK11_08565 [Candidatus Poribacteria bacterium]|mgnify:FL=1|jgi:hypothetical protein|nr:hypothetical protein [Candidatus Poribacteria bacterium]